MLITAIPYSSEYAAICSARSYWPYSHEKNLDDRQTLAFSPHELGSKYIPYDLWNYIPNGHSTAMEVF